MKVHSIAARALEGIQSNQRLFIHGAAATPLALIEGLIENASRLKNVELLHIHTEGRAPYVDPKYVGIFKVANLFVGGNMRKHLAPFGSEGRIDYIPCFLSEMPTLIRSGRRKIDTALVHVSPPDKHGYCSLGTSVDIARAAVESAQTVIAQINPKMPRVHGDGIIHISQIHHSIQVDTPIPESHTTLLGEDEKKIGLLAAGLIENGSTLQMGIGSVPDAVLAALKGHKDLGIHTEMWSDGTLDLIECGAVNNSKKVSHPGKTVSTFVMGSKRVYQFIDDNPSVVQLDASYVNSVHNIARNPRVVAINSAVEIDLTGQVCADSIGSRVISGVGGQMDFIRGASLSQDGKPIIALTSRSKKGAARIVSQLRQGAGVVTTRAHVHYVITEYGIADLYGKTLYERAMEMIKIAHPEDRERLLREAHEHL